MATRVFGMNQALDGYVDHAAFAPSPARAFRTASPSSAALTLPGCMSQ